MVCLNLYKYYFKPNIYIYNIYNIYSVLQSLTNFFLLGAEMYFLVSLSLEFFSQV